MKTRQFHLQKRRSGQPCNYKSQIFGSLSSPWQLRDQPSHSAGTSMTRPDGPLGAGSQHHLPEIAKPKAHTSRFWAVWSGADTAFQRGERWLISCPGSVVFLCKVISLSELGDTLLTVLNHSFGTPRYRLTAALGGQLGLGRVMPGSCTVVPAPAGLLWGCKLVAWVFLPSFAPLNELKDGLCGLVI